MRSRNDTTYIALVRGINVGRAKQVPMSDLRALVESLGFEDVRTLLRSGNVVFRGSPAVPETIAGRIEQAIVDRLRMRAGVVVRTAEELAAVVASHPIPEAAASGAFLHVMFLAGPLTAAERTAIGAEDFDGDTVRAAEREIYVWYRNGMSGSDTAAQLGRLVRTLATDRNWNTVLRLLTMATADSLSPSASPTRAARARTPSPPPPRGR